MSDTSFSFQALREASDVELASLKFIPASDDVTLAYRRYTPVEPCIGLLFYHGGGAHSGAGYQHLGHGPAKGVQLGSLHP